MMLSAADGGNFLMQHVLSTLKKIHSEPALLVYLESMRALKVAVLTRAAAALLFIMLLNTSCWQSFCLAAHASCLEA